MMSDAIRAALRTYVVALDALMLEYHGEPHEPVTCEVRRKYAKIIRGNGVYSYVDLSNGDVLKGNWKGPELAVRHIVRGNVVDGTWLDWHGPWGLGYADSHGEFRRALSPEDYMVARDAIMANNDEGAAAILRAAIHTVSESRHPETSDAAQPVDDASAGVGTPRA